MDTVFKPTRDASETNTSCIDSGRNRRIFFILNKLIKFKTNITDYNRNNQILSSNIDSSTRYRMITLYRFISSRYIVIKLHCMAFVLRNIA